MESSAPIGLEYFDTLRAENESAWLSSAFIPPGSFDSMRGMRSIIVFGDDGSGKTALRLALIAAARENTGAAAPLIVEWQPGVQGEADGNVFVTQFVEEILDLASQGLARSFAQKPERFRQASRWAQEAMVWLIHRYLRTDPTLFRLSLEDHATTTGLECLDEIFSRSPKALISASAPFPRQMTEVIQTLKAAGFSGLWVMIDGLESWLTIESTALGRTLTALFSTLAVFDIPGFAVKVMAPISLKNLVSTSTGLTRRRFDIFYLDWSKEALRKLCERRLALTCGKEIFALESLSEDPSLILWLEKYGGAVPRGWLEFLRVFLDAYLVQPLQKPLTPTATAEIHRQFPPRLRIDVNNDRVFLDYQLIAGLSVSSQAILHYLYQHPMRSCSKEELYYRGLRGLVHEPYGPGDPDWEAPKTIEAIMDTALWRLRQSLEPNTKKPIYIVSDRGKGVIRLDNAW